MDFGFLRVINLCSWNGYFCLFHGFSESAQFTDLWSNLMDSVV